MKYTLTPQAEEDLIQIYLYGFISWILDNWIYLLGELKEGLWKMQKPKNILRLYQEKSPVLNMSNLSAEELLSTFPPKILEFRPQMDYLFI